MAENIIIVIPARYGSTRFPGKPLAQIAGKSMIHRVHSQSMKSERAARIIVATDDERIHAEVERFGGEVVMTPTDLASGTERMAWVAKQIEADIYVNVQGDEPLLPPSTIDAVVVALEENAAADIATACCPLRQLEDITNPNVVKVVTDQHDFALYFSRAPIPYDRNTGNGKPHIGVYRKHIGIYAFRRAALLRFAGFAPSPLELLEKLEQLRALERGMRIVVAHVPDDSQAVDSPEDILKVEQLIRNR